MASKLGQIAIVIIYTLLATACNYSQTERAEKLNIPIELNDGDIAFRRGIGAMSHLVIAINKGAHYSHVGIVKIMNDEYYIVHEVPYEGDSKADDKICCEPIADYFDNFKASAGAIFRLEGMNSMQRAAICNYALKHLELNTPFDHDYDLSNDKALYCSELIWRCYIEIGVDIANGSRTIFPTFKGDNISPSDIETNKNLNLLYSF